MKAAIILTILFLICGGVVYSYVTAKQREKRAEGIARREALEYTHQVEAALKSRREILSTNVARGEVLLQDGMAILQEVEGVAAPEPERAGGGAAGAVKQGASRPRPGPSKAFDPKNPAGLLPRKVLEAQWKNKKANTQQAPENEDPLARASAETQNVLRAEKKRGLSELQAAGEELRKEVDALLALLAEVDGEWFEIERRIGKAEDAMFAYEARALNKKAYADIATLAGALERSENHLNAASKTVDHMRLLKKQHEDRLAAAREDAEQRRKEAEHSAQVTRELAVVASVDERLKDPVAIYKFADALKKAEAMLANIETDEAKAPMKVRVERYKRAAELKAFVISQITKHPFRWGWTQGLPVGKDIIAIDESTLKLVDSSVNWPDVKIPQLQKMVEYAIAGVDGVRMSVQGEQYLNAAICMQLLGAESASETMHQRMLQTKPELAARADELLLRK